MTTPRLYTVPFASSGDLLAVPDAIQVDGSVSYTQGWGVKYETLVASGGLDFPRAQNNQLLFDLTNQMMQYQNHGTPDYYSALGSGGAGYSKYDRVRYLTKTYVSLVDTNTALPTVAANWVEDPLGNVNFYTGGTSTGSANSQVVATLFPSGFSLSTNGATVACTAGFTNSGATQFNLAGTGLTNVKKESSGGLVALAAGDIVAGDSLFLSVNVAGSCLVLNDGPTLGTLAALNYDGANFTASGGNLAFGSAPVLPSATTATTQTTTDNSTKVATDAFVQANKIMTALGVGSIILARHDGGNVAAGATVAAASLTPCYLQLGTSGGANANSDTIAGTWQALGGYTAASTTNATIWQRTV